MALDTKVIADLVIGVETAAAAPCTPSHSYPPTLYCPLLRNPPPLYSHPLFYYSLQTIQFQGTHRVACGRLVPYFLTMVLPKAWARGA